MEPTSSVENIFNGPQFKQFEESYRSHQNSRQNYQQRFLQLQQPQPQPAYPSTSPPKYRSRHYVPPKTYTKEEEKEKCQELLKEALTSYSAHPVIVKQAIDFGESFGDTFKKELDECKKKMGIPLKEEPIKQSPCPSTPTPSSPNRNDTVPPEVLAAIAASPCRCYPKPKKRKKRSKQKQADSKEEDSSTLGPPRSRPRGIPNHLLQEVWREYKAFENTVVDAVGTVPPVLKKTKEELCHITMNESLSINDRLSEMKQLISDLKERCPRVLSHRSLFSTPDMENDIQLPSTKYFPYQPIIESKSRNNKAYYTDPTFDEPLPSPPSNEIPDFFKPSSNLFVSPNDPPDSSPIPPCAPALPPSIPFQFPLASSKTPQIFYPRLEDIEHCDDFQFFN